MKIYKNVKLHYWTYSSILINTPSLSFKQVFLCLCFLHQNYTEGISSILFLPFQSLFSAITHIHQSLKTCTPQTLSKLMRTCTNFSDTRREKMCYFTNLHSSSLSLWTYKKYVSFTMDVDSSLSFVCLTLTD